MKAEGSKLFLTLGFYLFLLSLCATSLGAPADPENILVEGYTFVRPSKWTWEAPGERSGAISRFLIPGKNGMTETDVAFFYLNDHQPDIKKRVLGNFDNKAEFSEMTVQLGKTNLTFVRVRGTATIRKPSRPNYQLFGVMLKSRTQKQYFFARVFGPQAEVQAAEHSFRKMIQQAVEESGE